MVSLSIGSAPASGASERKKFALRIERQRFDESVNLNSSRPKLLVAAKNYSSGNKTDSFPPFLLR